MSNDQIVRDLYRRFMNDGDRTAAHELIAAGFVDHSNPAADGVAEWCELQVFRVDAERIVERWGLRARPEAAQV